MDKPYFVVVATYRREIMPDDILGTSSSYVEDRKEFKTCDEAQRYMKTRFYDDCDFEIFHVKEDEITCSRAPRRRFYKLADKWYHKHYAINATDVYNIDGHYIETVKGEDAQHVYQRCLYVHR